MLGYPQNTITGRTGGKDYAWTERAGCQPSFVP